VTALSPSKVVLLVGVIFVGLGWAAPANGSLLPPVPDSLSDPLRSDLLAARAGLQSRLDSLNQRTDKFNADCNSVDEHSSKVQQCQQEQASIRSEKAALLAAVEKFKGKLGSAGRLATLDKEIAETEKQLRQLTLQKSIPQFAWFAGQSEQAQEHMVNQLISRVRDYAIGKSESAMQDHFLDYIRTMKPKEVNKLAELLRNYNGTNSRLFQDWLRSFSPKASRIVLVEGSKLAIEGVKKNEDLFKIGEDVEKGTIEAKQDAALTVLAMVADYPGLKELQEVKGFKELKAVATSYFLQRDLNELSAATDNQLANQKQLVKRMKDLIDERNKLVKR